LLYTVVRKKCDVILDHNSNVSWWIFTILLPMETGMNALWGIYNIYNLPPTVSPRYLLKLKRHKQSSQYFITQQKNESVCEISEQYFLSDVFRMAALLGNSFSNFLAKSLLHSRRFLIKVLSLNSACFI